MMAHLFDSITIKDITIRSRIGVSPMCQYSCVDGQVNEWHLVHLGSRAVGGAGLIVVEATAIEPEGRISHQDTGIWNDDHVHAFIPITKFIKKFGATAGIQLAHAGRKASSAPPFEIQNANPQTWKPKGPSPIAFSSNSPIPSTLSILNISEIILKFAEAAERSFRSGFEVLEIHAAHGYLLHSFLSPLSNTRTDQYGGSFKNRIRILLEIVSAIQNKWPERFPLGVRLSCTDWVDGGWSLEDSIELSRKLKKSGVDFIDCSSGGSSPSAKIPVGPGYQIHFSQSIKKQAGIVTMGVGLITNAKKAEQIIATSQADVVLLGREFLRNPYWPIQAAEQLHYPLDKMIAEPYKRAYL